jgi:hypothetical protein
MKHIKKLLIPAFHTANLILVIFYLFPGSILGCFLYNDCNIQPQITRDFIISSNHLYIFIILSALGIIAYQDAKKKKIVTIYLFLLSILLELAHIVIPNREFEWGDLFGNILGIIFVIIIYKVKNKYV